MSKISPKPLKFKHRLGAAVVINWIRLLRWTTSIKVVEWGEAKPVMQNGPAVFCFWHNRLAMVIPIYLTQFRPLRPEGKMAALISASRDGGMLARALDQFGVKAVRGSSSRRGAQALLEATRLAKEGWDFSVTPDGPRGPCYSLKPGALAIAAATGLPLITACYELKGKITLKSWDRFQIPLPGSRCEITFGKVFHIPKDADIDTNSPLLEEVRNELLRITPDRELT